MRIESRYQRLVLAAFSLAAAGVYIFVALQFFLASHFAAVPNQGNLQRAIQLEPSNAEYRDRMGEYLSYTAKDPGIALPQFQAAVRLNPYVARYWLDLANNYFVMGRTDEQRQSLERAVGADPTTPRVAWEAGNFFLLDGDRDRALQNFRVVLSNDPTMVDQALQLCWRVTGDVDVVLDQALPKRSEIYFSFLKLLIEKKETAGAIEVWKRLVMLREPFALRLAFPYIRFLLAQQQVSAAKEAWQQLANLDPTLSPYLTSPSNLIVNGSFEEKILDGGFDWLYVAKPHVEIAIDTNDFHSGTRSLSMTFDGQNPADAGIYQFIPVEPNTEYQFTAAYRADDLLTASGPRFSISDAYNDVSYALTDDVIGTWPWHTQQVQFRTSPSTDLLLLRVIRQPSAPLIKGKLWIDDLKLVKGFD
jgi:tetratricopeptide (TPR) repeat protein